MGILDKLGIRKKTKTKLADQPVTAEAEQAEKPKSQEQKKSAAHPGKGNTGRAYQILVRPILSEKGTHLAGKGKYVFAVHPAANKSEIKKSIQLVYNVRVQGVHIVKMPSKLRRYGRSVGRTASWKKAIVTVAKGEKIPGIIESVG